MKNRGSHILVFMISLGTWMMLRWSFDPAGIFIGACFAFISSVFFGEFLTSTPHRMLELSRYAWFLYYIPVFMWEMVIANLDVARRVLHPALPINPGLVKIRTRLKNELSKTLLGNSLSLTPGLTTVDMIGDEIYIHCIDIKRHVQKTAEKFERIIERIFE